MSGALTFGTPYVAYEAATLAGGPYAATIVGADPMDDGSDATYVRAYNKDTIADGGFSTVSIPIDPVVVDGSLLQVTMRCSSGVASSTDPGSLIMRFVASLYATDPEITDYPTLNFSLGPSSTYVRIPTPYDGTTVHSLTVEVRDYMSGALATPTQIEEYFAAGGWLVIQPDCQFGGEAIASVTVHEISATGGAAPPPPPPPPTPLAQPEGLTQSGSTPSTLTFSWTPVPDALDYEVRLNGGSSTLTGGNTRHTAAGLSSQTAYTFEVRALGAGAGTESPWASANGITAAPVRPHFRKAVRDGNGGLRTGATVALMEPGTTIPISEPVYSSATGPGTQGSTWVTESGIVDFYLEDPKVVDIAITPAGAASAITFFNQWVGDAENLHPDGLTAVGALSGHAPVADGAGGWSWGPVGGGVTSVNGQVGDVLLTAAGLGAVPATTEITDMAVLTGEAYDALSAPDGTTVYFLSTPSGGTP